MRRARSLMLPSSPLLPFLPLYLYLPFFLLFPPQNISLERRPPASLWAADDGACPLDAIHLSEGGAATIAELAGSRKGTTLCGMRGEGGKDRTR